MTTPRILRRLPLRGSLLSLGVGLLSLSCAADFDTSRAVARRGSLGQELFTLVCDRVGAQALREDVTGASYHAVCHADAKGKFADKIDASGLVPLDPAAVDEAGKVVPMARQEARRAYRIARIHALARRRGDLIKALDIAFPEETVSVRELADVAKSCTITGQGKLQKELGDVLSRLTDLQNDGTLPLLTRSLAGVLENVQADREAQEALARLDARQGYRPSAVALGAVRPVLAYPRFVELTNALLQLVASDSDPWNPEGRIDPSRPISVDNRKPIPGKANPEFQALLKVAREELRTAESRPPPDLLTITVDPAIPTRNLLSRPRSTLEMARQILLRQDEAFDIKIGATQNRHVTRRDPRGVAGILLVGGKVPPPFVDLEGSPGGGPDGLPDLDLLGQFVTTEPVLSPFFSPAAQNGARDPFGRALGAGGAPIYDSLETTRTFLAALTRDLRPLLDPDPARDSDAIMKALGAAPAIFGIRDTTPSASRIYAPDPSLTKTWALAHPGPPPKGLGTEPVSLPYRAFHPESSPVVDLVHALGQLLAEPATDDMLELARRLSKNHPGELARLVGLGLKIKQIADSHPEAQIPESSTLWDELLDALAKIAHEPGILEDIVLAFKKDETVRLQETFASYIDFNDELTYDRNNLNGPAFNLTTNSVSPLKTPVDRAQPDVGKNRSALQRFMQLLHDANGLAACTKEDAVVPIDWNGVKIHYPPQNLFETTTLGAACLTFSGRPAPAKLKQCGVLRFENVAALLLDVALGRAQFDVRDPCLRGIMNSPLTGIVGGVDAFLDTVSGIKGFNTHPTVNGVARMVFFDTPHDGLPGDRTPANDKTVKFLSGVLDPVPSTVCRLTPFTDTDGKVLPLRACSSFADTLRGRDNNSLFPIEQNDFIKNVQALAAAFADHDQPLLFVQLFDTLHLHWGSKAQSKETCNPALPRTDARWCSQDGGSSYEALLSDVLRKTDIFKALQETIPIIENIKISHCDVTDPRTGKCTKPGTTRTGIQVLVDMVRVLLDPSRSPGLKDPRGNTFAVRNDGTKNAQTTPIYLLIDAIKGMDAAFASYTNGLARQGEWRKARSQLVDTFFSVKGTGKGTTWANPAAQAILPTLVETFQAQVLARCPDRSSASKCAWGRDELRTNVSDTVGGPTFAAMIDLLEAFRTDDRARTELMALLQYLLDPGSENDALATTLAALIDVLQVLSDDTNLAPVYRAISDAAGESIVDEKGKVVRRGFADGATTALTRVFARAYDAKGNEQCGKEIDPNRVIAVALRNLVTPAGPDQPAPIEVVLDVVADVNRADPSQTSKLDGGDYANIALEVRSFLLDKGSGLEQIYEVVRQATRTP